MKILILLILLILSAATMVAAPAPPWLLDSVNSGDLDLNQFRESFANARLRGVDSANPIYGLDNPPFGSNGAISSIDNQMNVLIILVDFSDNINSIFHSRITIMKSLIHHCKF